jgi:hypothetical protein
MTAADSLLGDYIDRKELRAALVPPGKPPVSDRTIARYEAQDDGLPSVEVGGRKLYKIESVKEWLGRRERKPNPSKRLRVG